MENIKSTNITEMCISNQTNIVNIIQKEQNIIEFIKANDDIKIQYFIWYEKLNNDKKEKVCLGFCDIDNIKGILDFCKKHTLYKKLLIGDDVNLYNLAYKLDIKKTEYVILDFDDYDLSYEDIIKQYPFLENTCYTRGTRGKGFHFWCSEDNKSIFIKDNDVLLKYKADILVDFIFEDANNIVYFSNSFAELSGDDAEEREYIFNEKYCKKLLNHNTTQLQDNPSVSNNYDGNYDELEEIVMNIPVKYSNEYNDWIKIISILKKYNFYDLAKSFSKKSKKYNDEGFEFAFHNQTSFHSLNIATIYWYSKNNKTGFDKIKNKYAKLEKKQKQEKQETLKTDDYDALESEFQENHFKILDRKTFVKIPKDNRDIVFFKKGELKEAYEHLSYTETIISENGIIEKKKSFINKYLGENENLKQYEDMDIYPNNDKCPTNHFNLWTAFDVEYITEYIYDEIGLNFILAHIKLLCNNDELMYEYFLDWTAHLLFKPEEKCGKFILFVGRQGSGKSQICKFLSLLVGSKKYMETSKPDRDVWGDFNGSMTNSYLICIEELDFLQVKNAEGVFKNFITQPTIPINKKGKDKFDVKSYHRYIGSTNNVNNPIKTEDKDRRNVIIRCSDEKIGDMEYFEKLETYIQSKNTQRSFYDYLSNRDYHTFLKKLTPITEYHKDLKESFEDPTIQFIREYIHKEYNDKKLLSFEVKQIELFKLYSTFLKKEGYKYETNNKRFGMIINNLNYEGIEKTRKSYGMCYSFNMEKICKDLNIELKNIIFEENVA